MTKKYKEPNNKDLFNRLVDIEMEKAHFVNFAMAEEKANEEVGGLDCPYCKRIK